MAQSDVICPLWSGSPDSVISNGLESHFPGQDLSRLPRRDVSQSLALAQTLVVYDQQGNRTVLEDKLTAQTLPLGSSTLYLPSTGSALILPALSSSPDLQEDPVAEEDKRFSFSGSDMRVLIEPIYDDRQAARKQFIELATLTVSVHREKSPVRAIGYINPKGFARGRRTIAGTMILTQFTVDVLYRFLSPVLRASDASKDSFLLKTDQLPPFNMTLLFADEYGNASYRRLLGVDAVTDGTVYSVHDMMTEQTVSYLASDFTPLMPLRRSVLVEPSGPQKAERTPKDMINSTINFNAQGLDAWRQATNWRINGVEPVMSPIPDHLEFPE